MIPASLSPLANHVWQSTLFAVVAALLTLALRKNRAQMRYWLWLAASIKFLIPFSLLVSVGSQFEWRNAPALAPRLAAVIEPIRQPPAPPAPTVAPPAARAVLPVAPALLVAVWFCGCAAVLINWRRRWRRVSAIVRASRPLQEGRELDALSRLRWGSRRRLPSVSLASSETAMEPGVFGILRPVLWIPEGIAERLSGKQLEAILAHELCHVQRRDNLIAAVHMAVEAIFWFHPLVWWLGSRLAEERERACDEEVLRLGSEPRAYAEGILRVCEFYLASPLACAAGVTGADLKKRIEGIMTNRFMRKLSVWKKVMLAGFAIIAIVGPIAGGLMNPSQIYADAQLSPRPEFDVVSIKASPISGSGAVAIGRSSSPGSVRLTGITLKDLIARAYSLKPYQISGPAWLGDKRFDIVAKAAGPVSDSKQRLMLQSMLADRFQLTVHTETNVLPAYELVAGKSGLKIHEVTPDDTGSRYFPGRSGISATQIPMTRFAELLSAKVDRPVLDKTGLSGVFDIDLKWMPEAAGPDADLGPSIFTAIQEQLGLKLEARKSPIEVLVVDRMNKTPTEN